MPSSRGTGGSNDVYEVSNPGTSYAYERRKSVEKIAERTRGKLKKYEKECSAL